MTIFYAQPYDITASGFYFENIDDYQAKVVKCIGDGGQPVEEFEIQFIDVESIDAELFDKMG